MAKPWELAALLFACVCVCVNAQQKEEARKEGMSEWMNAQRMMKNDLI